MAKDVCPIKHTTEKGKYKPSIRGVLLTYMWGFLACSFLVFILIIFATKLFPSLDDTAFRNMHNHAQGSVSLIAPKLTYSADVAKHAATELSARVARYGVTGNAFSIKLRESVTYALEHTSATGAFAVLQGEKEGEFVSLYLRSGELGGQAGAGATAYETLQVDWPQTLTRLEAEGVYSYSAPMGPEGAGYWSKPHAVWEGAEQVVTYTVPVHGEEGTAIGIVGVEFAISHLSNMLAQATVPFESGFYLLARLDAQNNIDCASALTPFESGNAFLAQYEGFAPLTFSSYADSRGPIYEAEGQEAYFLAVSSLHLYDMLSPFSSEQYYIIAGATKDEVLYNSRSITMGLVASIGATMMLALLGALWMSKAFSHKIENLAVEVSNINPERPITLAQTNVQEIDHLADALRRMSTDLVHYAARMSNIVDMVGVPLGAFEIQEDEARVYFTESMFRLMRIKHEEEDTHFLPLHTLENLLPGIQLPVMDEEKTEAELFLEAGEGSPVSRWLRVRLLRQGAQVYGTVMDITEEVNQRKWLEYERDYDPLTRLLNRNSYPARMDALIDGAPDKIGVLLFGDLDNLKYINDTFGHDMGDRYIQVAANAMKAFEVHGGVVARISGDEFAVYLHGAQEKHALRQLVDDALRSVRMANMVLPDGSNQRVRISVGLAYYPQDATNIDTLVRYADFAMYEVKHSIKGTTKEFDMRSYDKNSFIFRKPGHLDLMIESRRLTFAFQPLIDVSTGSVFGYEALMRPLMREIHTPREVIALAKSQSKLYLIEKLTLAYTFGWLRDNQEKIGDKKLFINLIANQMLSPEDLEEVHRLLPGGKQNIVMEITESEQDQDGILPEKIKYMREMGYQIALDDYGSGYNGDIALLQTAPDYVKVDMSIVHNIDTDANRQKIMRQTAEYAKLNGIRVIAEGVETSAELRCVIALGVDIVQGYYLGRPAFELGQHNAAACEEAANCFRHREDDI